MDCMNEASLQGISTEGKVLSCRGAPTGCSTKFKFRNERLKHEKNCRIYVSWKSEQPKIVRSGDGRLTCSRCFSSYSDKTAFSRHKYRYCSRFVAKLKGQDATSLQGTVSCRTCEKKFKSKWMLSQHLKTDHGKICLRCPGCHVAYLRKDHFENHMDRCEVLRGSPSEPDVDVTDPETGSTREPDVKITEPVAMVSEKVSTVCHESDILKSEDLILSQITESTNEKSQKIPLNHNLKRSVSTIKGLDNAAIVDLKTKALTASLSGELYVCNGEMSNRDSDSSEISNLKVCSDKEVRELTNMTTTELHQHAKIGQLFLKHLKQLRSSSRCESSGNSALFTMEFLGEIEKVFGADIVKDHSLLAFILRETEMIQSKDPSKQKL